ncbi:MAG TPA: SDR family oxidoreductase [Nitrospiraceae bacterium]|nr:SDR family oxidoreductase [Nitrospiraceae bacterium]
MIDLKNQVALISGGGQGLGAAICRTLGEAGAVIVVADLKHDLAKTMAGQLARDGITAMALPLDVANEIQGAEALRQILEAYGRLDILVNNAAVDRTVSIEELTFEEWDRVMMTNLRGPFVLSKLALPVMKQQRRGHIVNMASTASKRAWANASAYHASKWGLLGFSHALHVEARPHQVKVTAVVSGGMRTPFLLDRFPDIDTATLQDPKNVAETIRCILTLPPETVVPEIMVIPMRETSWP